MATSDESRIIRDLISHGGFCFICGNADPSVLELHHFINGWNGNGRNIKGFLVHLCCNCHRRFGVEDDEKSKRRIHRKIEQNM